MCMAVVTVRMSVIVMAVAVMVMGVFIIVVIVMAMIVLMVMRIGARMDLIVPMIVVHRIMLGRSPMLVPVIMVVIVVVIMSVVRRAGSTMFHSRGLPSIDQMSADARVPGRERTPTNQSPAMLLLRPPQSQAPAQTRLR
jgi:hypothetical protein